MATPTQYDIDQSNKKILDSYNTDDYDDKYMTIMTPTKSYHHHRNGMVIAVGLGMVSMYLIMKFNRDNLNDYHNIIFGSY